MMRIAGADDDGSKQLPPAFRQSRERGVSVGKLSFLNMRYWPNSDATETVALVTLQRNAQLLMFVHEPQTVVTIAKSENG